MNTYSFSSTDTDWLLLNPELRKCSFHCYTNRQGWPHTTSITSAESFALSPCNELTKMQDLVIRNQEQCEWTLDGIREPGVITQQIHVRENCETSLLFTQSSMVTMATEFDIHLDPGSKVNIRYINFSSARQSHVRLNVHHSANSQSTTRVVNLAGKTASATAQVQMVHPEFSYSSSSDLKIINWNIGGRVGALPIIDASIDNIQAKHGTAYYTVDNELIFLLQLKGLRKQDAVHQIILGSLIEGLSLENTFYLLNLEQCLTDTLENSFR